MFRTIAPGDKVIPESNFRFSLREIISFTVVPPMSMTRTFFMRGYLLRKRSGW